MFRTIAALATAALIATGYGATSASAAAACKIGGLTSIGIATLAVGDVGDTSMCSGVFSAGITLVADAVLPFGTAPAIGTQQYNNEFTINNLAFAGRDDWTLAEEATLNSTTSNNNGFGLALYNTFGSPVTVSSKSGTWQVSTFGEDAVAAAVVLLSKANEWSIYLMRDLSILSGAWDFQKSFSTGSDGKLNELKSFQIYISTAVPVPAALPMLLTGLAGFAMFKRRNRAA